MPERARRLLVDFKRPAAIFTADGELIEAMPAARERLGSHRDLIALGAERLAAEASRNGQAEGDVASGRIAMARLGAGPTVTLLVTFESQQDAVQVGSHAGARASNAAAAIAASTVPNRGAPEARPRKFPLRFVWQMDAATRFTLGIADLAKLLGPKTAAVLDRPWAEIADALKIDTEGQIAQALAAKQTWSGVVVRWPVDDSDERLAVEMSGLPVFDRDRQFEGFRGFGLCRDTERLAALAERAPPIAEPPSANVLEFRAAPPPPPPSPPPAEVPAALSPGERSAFEELARELNARLKKSIGKDGAGTNPDDFDVEPEVEQIIAAPPPVEPPKAEQPKAARNGDAARDTHEGRPILDRLPIGILVYRLNNLIYANRAFLDWTGYSSIGSLAEAGGLDSLFIETNERAAGRNQETAARRSPSPPSTASRSRSKAACSAYRGTTKTRWC